MRGVGWLAVTALVVTAATGCSGPDQRASAGSDDPAASSALRIAIVADVAPDPVGLDPTASVDVAVADLLYDGLTAVDDAGAPVPALATSWTTDDGLAWRFTLDGRRRFSDGSAIRAADVVASLTAVVANRDGNLAASALDVIDGAADVGLGRAEQVRGLRAVDSRTVQIDLTAPDHELPALLADPAYGIVAPTGRRTLSPGLVSSGPYAVVAAAGDVTTLAPSDADSVDPEVRLIRFDDVDGAVAALRSQRVDVAPLGNVLKAPAGTTETFVSAARLALEVHVPLGHSAGPKAPGVLSTTIDRVAAVGAATRHDRPPAWSIVPFGGACDESCAGSADPTVLAAIAAAGPLRLDAPRGALTERVATELAAQLEAVGITVEVRLVDPTRLAADVAAGAVDVSLFAAVSRAPTPDPTLAAVFGTAGSENLSGYSSAEFDAGLAAARATADPSARRAAYASLERLATGSGAVVPLLPLGERFAVRRGVTGSDLLAGW